jgi:hypothetical protein
MATQVERAGWRRPPARRVRPLRGTTSRQRAERGAAAEDLASGRDLIVAGTYVVLATLVAFVLLTVVALAATAGG